MIKGLSTLEGAEASYDISMQTDAEESIVMNGTLNLNPLATRLNTTLTDMKIPRFSPYYADFVTTNVMNGTLDLTAELHFSKKNDLETIRGKTGRRVVGRLQPQGCFVPVAVHPD